MEKNRVHTENAPAAIGPYSQAIDLGSMVFTSGQIPVDPVTGQIPADVKAQAEQSLKNVKAILEAAGTSMEKVIKTTAFISDMNTFALPRQKLRAGGTAAQGRHGGNRSHCPQIKK